MPSWKIKRIMVVTMKITSSNRAKIIVDLAAPLQLNSTATAIHANAMPGIRKQRAKVMNASKAMMGA